MNNMNENSGKIYTPYNKLLLITSSSSPSPLPSLSTSTSPLPSQSVISSTSRIYLPFYKQLNFPPPPDEIPYLPTLVQESCGFKIIQGAIVGSILGVGLGIFMGAMGDPSPIVIINGKEVPIAPLREQMRSAYKSTISKSVGWAKNFGVLTALFGYCYFFLIIYYF
jgi:hypothetical protein